MINLEDINQTLITLTVGENHVLFIVLGADGLINRKGNGGADCKDNNLFMGETKENLFAELKFFITQEVQDCFGYTYDIPNKEGRLCELQILFKGNSVETGTKFLYGALSQGPPIFIRTFITKAVTLTDTWHGQQKYIASKSKSNANKRWWKFW